MFIVVRLDPMLRGRMVGGKAGRIVIDVPTAKSRLEIHIIWVGKLDLLDVYRSFLLGPVFGADRGGGGTPHYVGHTVFESVVR